MKLNNKFNSIMLALLASCSGLALQSCEDEPDKFELTGGKPTVFYIRPANVEAKDSLLTSAAPSKTICIVGKNLTSISEMFFNDQSTILNTSYITDNTMIVDVPKDIPNRVTDKIYMVTAKKDTVTYDFHVTIPAPVVDAMSCEFAKAGDEVTVSGNYLIDDPAVPITVTLPDGQTVKDFTKKTRTTLTFVMPDCQKEGPLTVTSVYGKTESKFHYLESRGMLFDFDGKTGLGNHGWHTATITEDETSITGKFLQFGDGVTALDDDTWSEGTFSFEYWPGEWTTPVSYIKGQSEPLTDLVDFTNYQKMAFKFEVYVPTSNPWSNLAMQIIPSALTDVTCTGAGVDVYGNNVPGANTTYFQNDVLPRALWRPWQETGSYDTGGKWVTVTIPMEDIKYGMTGVAATGSLSAKSFAGLELFVMGGGITGKSCKPIIKIDNIRAVPIK